MRRLLGLGATLVALCAAAPAWAAPALITLTATDDDATVTLRVPEMVIRDDSRSFCEVRVVVVEDDIAFQAGDTIKVEVREDDLIGSELLWSTEFTVSGAGRIDRTFDCTSNFLIDISEGPDVYARAEVRKAGCGFGCWNDSPQTANRQLDEIVDDAREPNNSAAQATMLGLGTISNLVNRDQDWFVFEVAALSNITVTTTHFPSWGRLDTAIVNGSGTVLGTAVDDADGSRLQVDRLAAGTYYVRVSPRVGNDFNFFDLRLTLGTAYMECGAADLDSRPCGNCGQSIRGCLPDNTWGPWGDCQNEGVCTPGNQEPQDCGNCGTRNVICSAACEWSAGLCQGEGPCAPGTTDTQPCGGGGSQTRTCDELCQWSAWGECTGSECTDGDTMPCYDGPTGTRGVGACEDGARACSGGAWGACAGSKGPSAEQCSDTVDNDCNGLADAADPACAPEETGFIGDACDADDDCDDPWVCLGAPDLPVFAGGYCGRQGCQSNLDCSRESACTPVFGDRFCLARCPNGDECREGYLCHAPTTTAVCVPRCRENGDCGDAARPVCNTAIGLCEAGEVPPQPDVVTPPVDTWVKPEVDEPAGPDTEDPAGPDVRFDFGGGSPDTTNPGGSGGSSGGCTTTNAASPLTGGLFLLLALFVLALGRRRARG